MDANLQLEMPEIPHDNRLAGKAAVVTGAGSHGALAGSGAAIAILLAAKGAKVLIVDRDESRAEYTGRHIEANVDDASCIVADITTAAACREVAGAAMARFGRLDILVNNAAIAPVEEGVNEQLWHDVLDLNLTAAKLMMDAVIPHMMNSGGGSIVNIASTAGLRGGAGIAYSAAKSGLMGLTRAMAYSHGRARIRINSIAPGHMHTPMGIGLDQQRRLRAAAGLVDKEGTAWDIAYAALFLASDESSWITAVTLPVDGGTTQAMPLRMFPHLTKAAQELV
jgi:NAD(P)-dependent dehydrogenase (short-subunit alcohol dehydrogenase family)